MTPKLLIPFLRFLRWGGNSTKWAFSLIKRAPPRPCGLDNLPHLAKISNYAHTTHPLVLLELFTFFPDSQGRHASRRSRVGVGVFPPEAEGDGGQYICVCAALRRCNPSASTRSVFISLYILVNSILHFYIFFVHGVEDNIIWRRSSGENNYF